MLCFPTRLQLLFLNAWNVVSKLVFFFFFPFPRSRFIAENLGFSQVHHIAYDCNNIPWEHRIKAFADRGMSVALQGRWNKDCRFAFFEDEDTGTTFETIAFEEGYDYPEPDEWFPAKEGESTEEGKEKEKEKKDD